MRRISFNDDWSFYAEGKECRMIQLPHDAMQEQGRAKDAPSGRSEAFFLGGTYHYEKKYVLPQTAENKKYYLEFEGIYPCGTIYLNGNKIGENHYGYTTCRVELNDLKFDSENVIEVEVDDENHPNSRWYGGAGIYRPVWLLEMNEEHIELAGIRVTTTSISPAKIVVEVDHHCEDVQVISEIYYQGKLVARGEGKRAEIAIDHAKLWSADSPALYECRVSLRRGDEILDEQSTNFGIRQIEWSMKGMFVNGESVHLKGGCIHQDHGILGTRAYDVSEYRRIKRMKEFGFNAIRSAHNPLSRAALEACDTLGMYVMDEAWDTWTNTKSPYDHGVNFLDYYQNDIKDMTQHDYNHPSVIMYSIGNEVTEPVKPEGVELGKQIIKEVKKYDTTRPVTAGINLTLLFLASMKNNPIDGGVESQKKKTQKMDSTEYNKMVMQNGKSMTNAAGNFLVASKSAPILKELDICGYNYATSRYKKDRKKRIIVGSETYCYELGSVWPMVEKYPHVIGDFMWTAWDYIGEVGIGAWSYAEGEDAFDKEYPWLLADTGAFDILGNDNAEAGLAAIVWDARTTPYVAVKPANHPGVIPIQAMWRGSNAIPSWSWNGCEGNDVEVEVYSKAPQVELFVNGKSIGVQKTKECKATFKTTYEPGECKAISYEENGNTEETTLTSAFGDFHVRIQPEEKMENDSIVYVNIDIVGENDVVESNYDRKLSVSVEGGELLGFGSANPCTTENFLDGCYTTYYGRAQAVIRITDQECIVKVIGEDLGSATKPI